MKLNNLTLGIILMILSAACTSIGQAMWKLAVHGIYSWELYCGFFLYGFGAILMITAFKFGSLSVLHPLLSIGYVFAILIGLVFLNEYMTTYKWIGNGLIVVGAIFVGLGGRNEQVKE